MAYFAGGEMTEQQSLTNCINTQLAGTAIVVNFVTSVGTEEVVAWHSVGAQRISVCIERRAVGPDYVVINERMTVGAAQMQVPVGGEVPLQQAAGVEGIKGVWHRPGLEAEHHRRINRRWDDYSTQQLIASFRAFYLVLIFKVGHE